MRSGIPIVSSSCSMQGGLIPDEIKLDGAVEHRISTCLSESMTPRPCCRRRQSRPQCSRWGTRKQRPGPAQRQHRLKCRACWSRYCPLSHIRAKETQAITLTLVFQVNYAQHKNSRIFFTKLCGFPVQHWDRRSCRRRRRKLSQRRSWKRQRSGRIWSWVFCAGAMILKSCRPARWLSLR